MPRSVEQLREVGFRLSKIMEQAMPGVGLVGVLLDVGGRAGAEQPINIILHGLREDEALQLLRKAIDVVERVNKEESSRIQTTESQLVVPTFMDLNKLKG